MTEVFFVPINETDFQPFEVGLLQWLWKSRENDNDSLFSMPLRIEIEGGRTLEMLPGTAAFLSIGT